MSTPGSFHTQTSSHQIQLPRDSQCKNLLHIFFLLTILRGYIAATEHHVEHAVG